MTFPRTRKSPAATGPNRNNYRPQNTVTTDPAQVLLPRLERVRKYGKGWRADCPVGHKSRGTLSIAQGDDGHLLLHDFAGCEAVDVLAAVGLSLADLYPDRGRDLSPASRYQRKQFAQQANWAAALAMLALEARIVQIAARDLMVGKALDAEDSARLGLACARIDEAREVLK